MYRAKAGRAGSVGRGTRGNFMALALPEPNGPGFIGGGRARGVEDGSWTTVYGLRLLTSPTTRGPLVSWRVARSSPKSPRKTASCRLECFSLRPPPSGRWLRRSSFSLAYRAHEEPPARSSGHSRLSSFPDVWQTARSGPSVKSSSVPSAGPCRSSYKSFGEAQPPGVRDLRCSGCARELCVQSSQRPRGVVLRRHGTSCSGVPHRYRHARSLKSSGRWFGRLPHAIVDDYAIHVSLGTCPRV